MGFPVYSLVFLFACRGAIVDSRRRRCAWCLGPSALMWSLWRDRNRRFFYEIKTPIFVLKNNSLVILCSWFFGGVDQCLNQFLNFVEHLD